MQNHKPRKFTRITVVSIALALLIGGCVSFSTQIQRHALDYNYTQEQIANQMILVNALRARDRRPMHFTTLSKITGSLEVDSGSELSLPFGDNKPAANSVNTFSPSLSISSSPNFDIVPENKSTFIKGINTPITLELFNHFWQGGWPKGVLAHIFINKIELIRKDKPPVVLINSPDSSSMSDYSETCDYTYSSERTGELLVIKDANNVASYSKNSILKINPDNLMQTKDKTGIFFIRTEWCQYLAFKAVIDEFLPRLRIIQRNNPGVTLGNYREPNKISTLGKLVEIINYKKISISRSGGLLNVKTKGEKNLSACVLRPIRSNEIPIDIFSLGSTCSTNKKTPNTPGINPSSQRPQAESLALDTGDLTIVVHFRSVQGAIYYLGEVIRTQMNNPDKTVCIITNFKASNLERSSQGTQDESKCPVGQEALFTVKSGNDKNSITSVSYHDRKNYFIPNNGHNDRSATVLSLLSQVFAMNRDASEIPTTSTVNVVN